MTILGIMIGVACVITMMTVTAGAQHDIDRQMREMGSNLMMVYAGSLASRRCFRGAAGSNAVLTEDDATAIKREIPENTRGGSYDARIRSEIVVGNRNWKFVCIRYRRGLSGRSKLGGVNEGRLFEPSELSRGSRVALVGSTTATETLR